MKKQTLILFFFSLFFLSFPKFSDPSTAAEWTFMVYIDGDNNLEGAGVDDINEMEVVGSTPQVNIVVQFDRIAGYDTSNGDWDDTRRGKIIKDSTSQIVSDLISIGEKNMGDPETLQEFVAWSMTNFPANNYFLVLWNHGDGWRIRIDQLRQELIMINERMLLGGPTARLQRESLILSKKIAEATKAICWDDTDGGDALTIKECREALEGINNPIDIIGFDACLMGMVEVAYEIKDVGNIMVASEQLEPNDGWPYDLILADLIASPSMFPDQLSKIVVSRYGYSYGGEETQSAISLSKIPILSEKMDNLTSIIISETTDWETIEKARNAASYFYEPDYRDLQGFLDGLIVSTDKETIKNAATQARAAFVDAVIENHSGPNEGAHGLSIQLIALGGDFPFGYNDSNLLFAGETTWDEFLNELSQHQIPDDDYEDNDTINDAWSLDLGEYQSLLCQDDDWFKVVLPSNSPLMATIFFSHTAGDLDLELYDSDLNLVDSSESISDTESVYIKAEIPGEYFIHIYGFNGATNRYDLAISTPVPDNFYAYAVIPYEWIDATNGTYLAMGDDDYTSVEVGFDFQFYGIKYTGVKISSNGYLTFGYVGEEYSNQPIPLPGEPSNLIAPFWDDLTPGSGNGVFYKIVGSAPHRQLVVQWDDVPHYNTTEGITFEVILLELTNEIIFQYQDVSFNDPDYDGGKSATVGVENSSGTMGTVYSYKNASLLEKQALRFYIVNSNLLNVQKIETNLTGVPDPGNPINITFPAKGKSSPLYYKFWKATGYQTTNYGNWELLQDWSTDNTLIWTPDNDDHYIIVAWVTDNITGSNNHQAGLSVETSGNSANPIQITELTTIMDYPQSSGSAITLNTTATGGRGPLYYQYLQRKGVGGQWIEIRGYDTSSSCNWMPTEDGLYTVVVHVTDDTSVNKFSIAGMTCTIGF